MELQKPKPFTSAGIILSYKCSSRCRHCLYCASNQWTDWINEDMLHAIYRGSKKTAGKRLGGFHLAGGEAFLNFPILLRSVELADQYGIPLDYVETNAHWFTDRDEAVKKLTALRDAGLGCLMISASPQHAEYIPLSKTLGAIEASLSVFGQKGTFVWLTDFLRELTSLKADPKGTIPFEDYAKAVGDTRARYAASYGGHLVPGGRAPYGQQDYLPGKPVEACFEGTCEFELLRCGYGHYDLYGNILPCSCSGITLGNAEHLESLTTDFNLDERPVLKLLAAEGVEGLYGYARDAHGYQSLGSYSGKCHLCMDIRRHLVVNAGDVYKELRPLDFYRQV